MSNGGGRSDQINTGYGMAAVPPQARQETHSLPTAPFIARDSDLGRFQHKIPIVRPGYLELTISPLAPSFARAHVERMLARWGLEKITDVAQLVTSELVTNAIKASGLIIPDDYHASTAPYIDGSVWVGLYQSMHNVVIEVWDSSKEPPCVTEANPEDLGGRGLLLVDDLAVCWGYRRPVTGGKWVWATLAIE